MSDRKYRHRGYQDDNRDRDDRRQRPREQSEERGKPRIEGAPRGRGVGKPGAVVFKCSLCGHQMNQVSVARDTLCGGCGKPLHTCTNCSYFNPGARFECTKPVPKRLESKVKPNECSFFQPKTIRELRSKSEQSPQDARSAFDALFKK